MRVVVTTCWKYRDTWEPFEALYAKHWPTAPHTTLLTDVFDGRSTSFDAVVAAGGGSWCKLMADYASKVTEPILLLLDDFFLTATPNDRMLQHALRILSRDNAGAVRIYPCPGANEESGDSYYGMVSRHTQYRNSLQATIYRPQYLRAIAERFDTPQEFELQGSSYASAYLKEDVWAFKRDMKPWPIHYECTAIVAGKWQRSALDLCKREGISVDLTLRDVI